MFGGIGMPEMTIILLIVIIIFGAGKLPEIGFGLGKAIKNFKKAAVGSAKLEDSIGNPKITKKNI